MAAGHAPVCARRPDPLCCPGTGTGRPATKAARPRHHGVLSAHFVHEAEQAVGKIPLWLYILLGIDSIFSHRRTGGFEAGLEKYCPNVEVVGEQTAEWLRTKGQEVASVALQQYPDIF